MKFLDKELNKIENSLEEKQEKLKELNGFKNLNYIEQIKLSKKFNFTEDKDFADYIKEKLLSSHLKKSNIEVNNDKILFVMEYGYIIEIPLKYINNSIYINVGENNVFKKEREKEIEKLYTDYEKEVELKYKNLKEASDKLKKTCILNIAKRKKILREKKRYLKEMNSSSKKLTNIIKKEREIEKKIKAYEENLIKELIKKDINFFINNKYNVKIDLLYIKKNIRAIL